MDHKARMMTEEEKIEEDEKQLKPMFYAFLAYTILFHVIGFALVFFLSGQFKVISIEMSYFVWCGFDIILAIYLIKSGPDVDSSYFILCKLSIELLIHIIYVVLLLIHFIFLFFDLHNLHAIIPATTKRSVFFAFLFFLVKSFFVYYGEYGINSQIYRLVSEKEIRDLEAERERQRKLEAERKRQRKFEREERLKAHRARLERQQELQRMLEAEEKKKKVKKPFLDSVLDKFKKKKISKDSKASNDSNMASLALRLPRLLTQVPVRLCSSSAAGTEASTVAKIQHERDPDEPVQLAKKSLHQTRKQMFVLPIGFCKLVTQNIADVKLDYKNTRLLQQFVSSFSGRVYEQHVTGLCEKQYRTLLRTIKYSRKAGYMPVMTKDPKYLRDPKLFDPMKPIRPHSFA
ncbi:putative ribosomal protein S18 [Aphelenchoides bicaudatus]|nr:putative ribosomal protein S18 [Aphelenchoides bicaudatus]